ncbi:response regulator [Minicystis rosea]|nr:response regulator [Minicystis rosea]
MADLLVVDDNEDTSECVASVLSLEGHRVRLGSNGEQGLAALNDRLPDLVILDVDMPVLDGPGMAYRMFLENCRRELIPIVLSSAAVWLSEIATRIGTPYYIGKPFDPTELMSLVTRALEKGRLPVHLPGVSR